MKTNSMPGSAKIYEFPKRGHFAAKRQEANTSIDLPQIYADVMSGSWYHDAAVKESDRARKP